MIFALAVFKQPLPQECMENLARPASSCSNIVPVTTSSQQPQQSSRIMNWLWRRRDKDENKSVSETDSVNDSAAERQDTPACKNDEDEMAVIMDPTDLSSSQLEETVVSSSP